MNAQLFDWLPEALRQPAPTGSRDRLTVVHTTKPCGKRFTLGTDGEVDKDTVGDVIEGTAITVHVPDAEAMAALLRLLPPNHYIIPDFIAQAGREPFEIMATWRLNKALGLAEDNRPLGRHTLEGHDLPVFAKLKENFTPGAWRLFDFDRDDAAPAAIQALTTHEAIVRLERAIPGLPGCGRVIALSSSGRVLKDGKPVGVSPNFHMWVQVADPELTDQFRQRLLPRLFEQGLGWAKPRGGKIAPAGIIDRSVFAISRCVYAGAPAVGRGLTLADADVLPTEGNRLVLAALPEASDHGLAELKRLTGVDATRKGDGSTSFHDAEQLQPDTVLEIRQPKRTLTLAEFFADDSFVVGEKYRCQTPFRNSQSWNGILRKYANGSASVCDNGTGIAYWYNRDATDGFDVEDEGAVFPELNERPAFRVFDDGLEHSGQKLRPGVWYFGTDKDGEPTQFWVCTPMHIDAVTFDPQDNNYGRLLRFKNTNGRWREWAMPMELLAGLGNEIRAELLAMGMGIDPSMKSRNLLGTYLQGQHPKRRMTCAHQVGWAGGSFVLPDAVIGPEAMDVVFQSGERGHDEYTKAGTLAGWQEGVAARAIGNPLLALALSAAFAGPLLGRCHAESGGVHYHGDSSTGKTTLIEAASSVWGGAAYKRSWRATANGMEGAAAMFNDGLLALDEISECDPREVGAIVYALANGVGKQRANRTGNARAPKRWRVAVLSSGERTIAATMQEAGHRQKAGQSVRLLDIPAARTYGAWDDLHGAASGAAFSDAIKNEAAAHHGYAGRAFLEKLTRDGRDFGAMFSSIKALPEFAAEGGAGQDARAAGRFALVAMAGELATEYGITCWPKGEAIKAAAEGFRLWRASRGKGNDERRQILSQLAGFIERHGDSRFSGETEVDTRPVHNRAGWWRGGGNIERVGADQPDGRVYLFNSDGMREALAGFDFKRALDVLQEAGVLPPPGKNGERAQFSRINGRGMKLYPVQADRLLQVIVDVD